MRIFSKSTLREFWEKHPDSEDALRTWYRIVEKSQWENPHDVKEIFGDASIIGDNRIVFNIKGNEYRIVVFIDYEFKKNYICFIGTHEEYNKIDAKTVVL